MGDIFVFVDDKFGKCRFSWSKKRRALLFSVVTDGSVCHRLNAAKVLAKVENRSFSKRKLNFVTAQGAAMPPAFY